MEVELDAFSGRPNPRWRLHPHQAREFTNKLHRLPRQHKRAASAEQGLGYRGFIVTGTGDELGSYDEVVVTSSSVRARSGSVSHYFENQDRALERWLLETMRGRVDQALYTYVLGSLS
jgi:hypothetical protein